tara:strand:- start:14883 stop:15398 length:516 start_codon:yes stop_codon:yes gene_type:complete
MSKAGAGGANNLDGGGEASVETHQIAVNEEVIWKARAEEAEEQIEALRLEIAELETALTQARESLVHTERRSEIDRELTAAKAVDLETARLLTEAVIAEMDEPDVATAVRELCDRKPFLFGCGKRPPSAGVSMSPSPRASADETLGAMAHTARNSGDRSELLRYLRARRAE